MPRDPGRRGADGAGAKSTPEAARSTGGTPEVGPVTHRTARNVGFATLADVVGKVGAFVFLIVGARVLSQSDFGAFSYAFALAGLMASILLWGFDDVLIREASLEPERLSQLVAETYVWRLVVGIPVFVGVAVAGVIGRPTGTSVAALLMVLLALFLDTSARTATSAAQTLHRLQRVAAAQLVNKLLTAVAGVAALALGYGLDGYAGAFLAGSAFGAVAIVFALRPIGVRADFSKMTRRSFAALGKASVPLGLDTIVAMALFKVDAVILAVIKGNESLAVYSVAYRLMETGLFVAFAVVAATFPVMSQAESLARVRHAVERGFTICAAVYVPFAVAASLRASGIIQLLFGAKYAGPAATPLIWLAFSPLLIAYGNIASISLVARRRVRGAVTASIVAMLFNVGLNLVLIPMMGPTGAAIATTAAYLFEAVILFVLCTRLYGVTRVDRALFESAVAGGLMALVLAVVHQGTIVDLAVAAAVYALAWLALSRRFAPQNVAVLRSFFRRAAATPDDLFTAIAWQAPADEQPDEVFWRASDQPHDTG